MIYDWNGEDSGSVFVQGPMMISWDGPQLSGGSSSSPVSRFLKKLWRAARWILFLGHRR